MELRDRTVLLTGATGGIGHAIARACAARGASLVLTGRRTDVLEGLAAELGAQSVAVDLADRAQLDRLLADHGDADVLIANAALPATGLISELTVEQIDRMLDVNLRAPVMMAQRMVPGMLSRGAGHLVFISSLSGKVPSAHSSIYNATKFGMRGFAGALREELHDTNVGVSTVFPGFIRDAGMFAEADIELPPGVGTRSPEEVAEATVRAIERNRREVDVAPLSMRAGVMVAGMAPELASRFQRRMGAGDVAERLAAGQAGRRDG
ncbi:SDR family NAD(P)-dependent oxidoreductase [Svornostia abyssi]|uniref:SDR family NAD(P)-dependent oxidoreductase n=1 Tax=Svornostia abyssi TaxID=2898438 RepID=A0ABY5PCQ7_9ACTN|nr:SDR family NAD(P)-dependent oxidoreductase [Parviterribacteraceae bacterium J379]